MVRGAPSASTMFAVILRALPPSAFSTTTVELFGAVPPLYLLFARFSFQVPTCGSVCALALYESARIPTTTAVRVNTLIASCLSVVRVRAHPNTAGLGGTLSNPEQDAANRQADDDGDEDRHADEAEHAVDKVP